MWIFCPQREQERLQAAARVARNDRDTLSAALEGLRRVKARLVQVEKGDAQALGFGRILKPSKPTTMKPCCPVALKLMALSSPSAFLA